MESASWDLLREEEQVAGMNTGESGHYLQARDRGLFRKKKNLILTIVLVGLLRSLSSKCLMN